METKVNAPRILIVDDEIGPRESLRMILKPQYHVLTVESGFAAIQMVQQMELDAVTLDLKMPGMSGIDTLKEIRRVDSNVMVIIITGYGTLQSAVEAIRHGVFDYISKPFNVPEIIQIIDKSVQRRKLNMRIKEFLRTAKDDSTQSSSELLLNDDGGGIPHFRWTAGAASESRNYLEFAKALAFTLEERDPYVSGHAERVCYYSDLMAKRLSLSPQDRGDLQIASYLHDIGKIGISDRFTNKKGTLNSTDWAIIKQHTKKSIELLAPLRLSPNIVSAIEHHHERYDGTGYPDGLMEEQIPLGARIIALSDSYDSMTTARPYRKPLTSREALNELGKGAGKQFDPKLVALFTELSDESEEAFLGRHQIKAAPRAT